MSLEEKSGTAANGPAPESQPHHKASTAEYIASLRRRRKATQRVPVLACGRHADPWRCDCYGNELLSDVRADAAVAAADMLAAMGLPGIFSQDECRAMWRRGRRDLSVRSYRYSVGDAA